MADALLDTRRAMVRVGALLAVLAALLFGSAACCVLDFRPLPSVPPASARVAANGPWAAWSPAITSAPQAFSLGGRAYFLIAYQTGTGQPLACHLVAFDKAAKTWKASAFPECSGVAGLIPEVPPTPDDPLGAVVLSNAILKTTDAGETWRATEPLRPGAPQFAHGASVTFEAGTRKVSAWNVSSSRASVLGSGLFSSSPDGRWWERYFSFDFFSAQLPVKTPQLLELGPRLVVWEAGRGAYEHRRSSLLNPWTRMPLEQSGEVLLRASLAPEGRELLVQLRGAAGTSQLCRFAPAAAAPYWTRGPCGALTGTTFIVRKLSYFTDSRFLADAVRAILLTTDGGLTFTPSRTFQPDESILSLTTYSPTDALALLQSNTSGKKWFAATADGGTTWKDLP